MDKTVKLIKCDKCGYIDNYSEMRVPSNCNNCNSTEGITILNKDNAFDFIFRTLKPYILEGETLSNDNGKIYLSVDEEVKEHTCLTLIKDYMDFLHDLAVDNMNENIDSGDNYIAVRNISIDLYHLNIIKSELSRM